MKTKITYKKKSLWFTCD